MNNETIRVGLIGAGDNTKLMHIPGFKAIDGVEVVSVANRSRESGQRVADEFQIPTVYDRWRDLVESPDNNAICIGTWPYMHCTLVLAALENDKHVLTEARMAMDAEQAHIMLAASQEKPDLVTQIVPGPHTFEIDSTVTRLVAEGYLGDLLSIDMSIHTGNFVDRESPFHWRLDRELSGYNIMSMGIYYEALMRWVGPASSVMSVTRVTTTSRKDESGNNRFITIPDHIEVLCEMASGPMMHLVLSSVTGLAPPGQVWLFGTEGTLRLHAPMGWSGARVYGGRRGDGQLSEIEIAPEERGAWRVEEEFVNAIRGREMVKLTDFETGVRYMEFTEAVTRSAQTGQKIHLPL